LKRVRYFLEYAVVRTLLLLVDLLPLRACIAVAHGLGNLVYLLHAPRRRIAVENILAAGIVSDAREARRLARTVFRQFARVLVESVKSDTWFRKHRWQDCVTWKVGPELSALLDDPGAGLILACGHLGSWEIGGQLLSHRKPVVGITRKVNNPSIDRLMLRRRPRNRFELILKRDVNLARLGAPLREGKVLAMMIDQNAKRHGMLVDFFGRPASSHTSIALLHLITRTPICFGYCAQVAPMRFEFRATGPFRFPPTGDKEKDVRRILEHLNRELEAAVRASPGEYMWGHRRWRLPGGPR
jgi:KDO2-lipid IV(A) lauroyltransferase